MVAHLVRDQEVAGSSPVIQTKGMARDPFPSYPFYTKGELSEWLKEPASKTGVRQRTGGSNPSLTAQCNANQNAARKCGVFALVGVRRELAHVRMPAGAKSVA